MAKYKEGMTVRIRKDLRESKYYTMEDGKNETFVNEHMYAKRGKFVTIEEAREYKYKIEEDGWNWTDNMFEDIREENEI
jgi:hypothetical protein